MSSWVIMRKEAENSAHRLPSVCRSSPSIQKSTASVSIYGAVTLTNRKLLLQAGSCN